MPDGVAVGDVQQLCELAFASSGIGEGHLAVHFVGCERIRSLNAEHRTRDSGTDVLSFPVDGSSPASGPRELGDIVICPELTADLREAIVHGALHLAGMDHERDAGEMLALQRRVLAGAGR